MQAYKQPTRPKDESDKDRKGRQVDSWFSLSTHNDKIKYIYGNYNFWSWFRYWYIDTIYQQTLMIIDKGFYDYEYDNAKKAEPTLKSNKLNDEELRERLARIGIGTNTNEKQE